MKPINVDTKGQIKLIHKLKLYPLNTIPSIVKIMITLPPYLNSLFLVFPFSPNIKFLKKWEFLRIFKVE